MRGLTPYIADDLPGIDLCVGGASAVLPERTFWDKSVILHGQRRWFDRRGELRHGGQRISRHCYNVFKLLHSEVGKRALAETRFGEDCARHARLFFFSADYDLESAVPGRFSICPTDEMKPALHRDYRAMEGMIFGDVPTYDELLESLSVLESTLNRGKGN